MSKKLEYPNSSFDKSLELADTIDSLGDECSRDVAAEKMGQSGTSGSFRTTIGSAVKFNLVKNENGKLCLTPTYKSIKLSYTDEEKIKHKKTAFFSPPVFTNLYTKLKGKELPKDILPKMLVRDFGVEEADASKVSKYFVDGLTNLKLIENNIILDVDSVSNNVEAEIIEPDVTKPENIRNNNLPELTNAKQNINDAIVINSDKYIVQFIGPGMNTKLEIQEEDDLIIVEATLAKIRKKLKVNEAN